MTVLRSGSATDVGRVRTINQDMPLERPNLYAVADGMGGHVGGEVAARVAVETLERAFERTPTIEGLRAAFLEANTAVWQQSQQNLDLRGMGTTLTAAALVGGPEGHDVLALANVGDSRAYIFSAGELSQVTDDHSLAEERVRHGEITEAEAAVHPQRHILTRALGVSSEVDTDMWELELRTGDRILLCSDGLSNEVDLQQMEEVLGTVDDPSEAAQQLVDAANEHGGADNITVVVVDVQVGEAADGGRTTATPLGLGAATLAVGVATSGAAGADADADSDAAADAATPPADDANGTNGTDAPTLFVPAAGPPTQALPPPRLDDTLAPGSRLGFGSEPNTWAETGPRSDEFFLGTATAVPVARATTRVPPPPGPRRDGDAPPEKESRGDRRRRLGIPRRITFRVLGFILLIAAVPVAAYFVLKWYAYDNWIVTTQHDQIVIKQGQPGGVLWFHPKVVDHTGHTTTQVLPSAAAAVKSGVQKPSLDSAKRYVTSIVAAGTAATSTTTTTTTTLPVATPLTPTSPGFPTTTTTAPATTTTTAVTVP
ncbi:MAG TPA: Stp1/IreP family PP2C-type Ser/Thr phosphatase [Acidimicrobiales bacterium]|nr:Stp1/IreP family PP2C-type Ser/Thr phosphatase [Acidimicrobiales bacterium]